MHLLISAIHPKHTYTWVPPTQVKNRILLKKDSKAAKICWSLLQKQTLKSYVLQLHTHTSWWRILTWQQKNLHQPWLTLWEPSYRSRYPRLPWWAQGVSLNSVLHINYIQSENYHAQHQTWKSLCRWGGGATLWQIGYRYVLPQEPPFHTLLAVYKIPISEFSVRKILLSLPNQKYQEILSSSASKLAKSSVPILLHFVKKFSSLRFQIW